MSEPTDHTLALLHRMDAKLDRLQSDVTDLRGRLQRVKGRLTSLDARPVCWRPLTASSRDPIAASTSMADGWHGSRM